MVTSATSLETHQFTTLIGNFSYGHLKPELMFGYRLIEANGFHYKMAQPEKLLLDYLYLNSTLQSVEDFSALRLNQAELQSLINEARLKEYLSLFNKELGKRIKTLLNILQHA